MPTQPIQQPYGKWDSLITPLSMASGCRLGDLAWDESGSLVWWEGRADRGVLVVKPPGPGCWRDLNAEYSIRARLAYGGGDFTVAGGWVYFLEADSGRIYRQRISGEEVAYPVTPAFGLAAAPTLSPDRRWLVYVHSDGNDDCLAIVPATGEQWPQQLVSGADFYMQPVWHPKGEHLAWVSWNHPNMPWDGSMLHFGRLDSVAGSAGHLPVIREITPIAGGNRVAIFQPEFSPDGRFLAYISDQTGWWQLYLHELGTDRHTQLTKGEAEHGLPAWQQNLRTYTFNPNGREIFIIRIKAGSATLWRIGLPDGKITRVTLPEDYTWLAQPTMTHGGCLAMVASGGRIPEQVIVLDRSGEVRIVGPSVNENLPMTTFAAPQALSWRGPDQVECYGLYYPPHNPRFTAGGLPPLVALVHGGPTGQRTSSFDRQVQFFTSRGFAVLQVNFRGSSGYGRAYREALWGNWGIYDVDDTVSGACHLAEQGLVDGRRMVIMGSSAGGYTVLMALQRFPGFFKAGIDLYGISDHLSILEDTHKFEIHLADKLLGELPQAICVYQERSPINHVDRIQDPLAIFQGAEDRVVPQDQSDRIAAALQGRGVPVLYRVYAGEGHGFRGKDTIVDLYQEIERFLTTYVI